MQLSVQLYTVREPMSADPVGTLQKLREIGFEYVELAGTYGMSAEEFRKVLDDTGLKASGSHAGLDALEGDLGKVIADHKTLGVNLVILPWLSKETYADGWEAVARRVEPIAEGLADRGIEFAYHNHAFEFEDNGLARFFDTASIRVNAQLDLGWVHYAGENPADWVRKLGSRVTTVHLKDMTDNKEQWDAVAGTGNVDWKSALEACHEVGVRFGAIEMDVPPGDPLECTAGCFNYFKDIV